MTTLSGIHANEIKVGDIISYYAPIRRKWWEFWKPRIVGYELRKMRVTAASPFEGCGTGYEGVLL